MNEKSIPQALREQADAIEKLAQRIAKESKELPDEEDRRDGGELADALFAIQSKLRYEYSLDCGNHVGRVIFRRDLIISPEIFFQKTIDKLAPLWYYNHVKRKW